MLFSINLSGVQARQRFWILLALLVFVSPAPWVPADPDWPVCDAAFVRGEANGDDSIDLTDPIVIFLYLFSRGQPPICMDAADVDDNERLEITDSIRLLNYLFLGGPSPYPPFPEPGTDEPCDGEDDDGDGTVDEGCGGNRKEWSKYPGKVVFLVSDGDWHEALPWVPVSVWTSTERWCHRGYDTPDGVCVVPLLVYHREDTAFDADSTVHFLQQYEPEKVVLIGNVPPGLEDVLGTEPERGAGLGNGRVERVAGGGYLEYWSSYEDVVLVEDDYELALAGSVYASWINAPLIIEGHEPPQWNPGEGNVICVGDFPHPSCTARHSLEELQRSYAQETGTRRVVVVNPRDPTIDVREDFSPEKFPCVLKSLCSNISLAAPVLASAKHELLLTVSTPEYEQVDAFLDGKLEILARDPEFLTIVASPLAIEMSYPWTPPGAPGSPTRHSADAWIYAETDGEFLLDLAVGRIFGITVSDASSCVARSLVYDEVVKHANRAYVTRGGPAITAAAEVFALGKVLEASGYEVTATPAGSVPEDWRDQSLIIYNDHGSMGWAGISSHDVPYLDCPFVVTEACLTCAFHQLWNDAGQPNTPVQDLFCANAIRKGAVGYIGSTDTTGYNNMAGFLAGALGRGAPFGKAFMTAKNRVSVYDRMISKGDAHPMPHYTFLGDPTLRSLRGDAMPPPRLRLVGPAGERREYELSVPAMRIDVPDEVKNLCEFPQQVRPLYFTTATNRELGTSHSFVCGVDLGEGFRPVACPPGWKLLRARSLNEELTWMARQDPQQGCLFEGAHEEGFLDFAFRATLYERAPDLRISELQIVNRELLFSLENAGNAGMAVDVEISITLLGYGCPTTGCPDISFYVSPHYDPNFGFHTRADLEPSEAEYFRVPIPSEVQHGDGVRYYDDYPYYMVHLIAAASPDLIQGDYENDRADEILARG